MALWQIFLWSSLAHAARVQVARHNETVAGVCPPPRQHLPGTNGCFFKCESDLQLPMRAAAQKGLALDDTTLHWCPQNAHFHWPNTDEPVTSFRMFKAWASHWNEPWTSKETAWKELKRHLEASNGKVLVGTQISCNETQDDADWENVKAMVKIFGPKRLMGLAIGNELELLWTKESILGNKTLPACLERMWNEEYFLNKFHDRVREFDALGRGFRNVKVTSVFGGFILAEPRGVFYERKDTKIARIDTFIKNVTKVFDDRYAHTVNIYTYFEDHFIQMDKDGEEPPKCSKALKTCSDFKTQAVASFPWMIKRIRNQLAKLGKPDATLWIGETGWSFPKATTLGTKMKWCDGWSTREAFSEYYANFLEWDLQMEGVKGPDHIFYFTMRDSSNFGKTESFGLVGDGNPLKWCSNTTCKIQSSTMPTTTTTTTSTTQKATTAASSDEDSYYKYDYKYKYYGAEEVTTSTTTSTTTSKKKSGKTWQWVCNGFVAGGAKIPNRQGFGKRSATSEGECLTKCEAQKKCNFATFASKQNVCWLERIEEKPSSAVCDENRDGHSFWKGMQDDEAGSEPEAPATADENGFWKVCNGFVKKASKRRGTGSVKGVKSQSVCKQKCLETKGCNFVTLDRGSKTCWMENIPKMPKAENCDGNTNGRSHWKGKGSSSQKAPARRKKKPSTSSQDKLCQKTCPGMDSCDPQYGPGWCSYACKKGGTPWWCTDSCKCQQR